MRKRLLWDACMRCTCLGRPPSCAAVTHGLRLPAVCAQGTGQAKVVCRLCDNSSAGIERVAMPYVFKYLAAELAAMNIKISVGVK